MIPPALYDQLRYIEIHALRAVQNLQIGEYDSPIRGRGFEFDQHKRYQQGDDYRQIDWNVTARMRHPYVKKDFEEKEMTTMILADLSRSMEFATAVEPKKELLLKIAATLAFSAASDHMRVGLAGFTDTIELDFAPKKGSSQVWKILEGLWEVKASSRKTDILNALGYLRTRLKSAALIFCISDFIFQEDIFTYNLFTNLARRHEFIPVIIEDAWEERLPKGRGFFRLQDAELGGEMVFGLSSKKRDLYQNLMRERKESLQRSLYRLELDHLFLRPEEPHFGSLIRFFLARKRRR